MMKIKKQKRNMIDRAYSKGYQVGLSGRSKDVCPHKASDNRQSWLNGWRDGRTDNKQGIPGVSGAHDSSSYQHRVQH